ncbi:DUF3019 domain-containing protein [Marinomonas sp. 15G1-11]|uniref:DUF3019 domain-containing protein n=1 Tax=Marinomonas phaeophyticola TaxID=3004091 RepID=A0ABT4JYW8_9GAMM|nr:DUF3019 domain-containing protein [Marinomonas sp. 15G1-11]MCZ2723463.1 DUF3019 domain-containing protein [Marinomonas sp. 15G1-11]
MAVKFTRSVTLLSLLLILMPSQLVADNQPWYLKVEPNRCIALRQGQTCYQTLVFKWSVPAEKEYCFFQVPDSRPLTCWYGRGVLSYKGNFELDRSTVYQIRIKDKDVSVLETKVKVAWVYKTDRKNYSEWRLF